MACDSLPGPVAIPGRALTAISFLVCSVLWLPCAEAWSNGGYSADPDNPDYGTHDWILDMALTLQTRDVTFLKTTYHDYLLLGSEAPDNPQYIGDTTKHHIYFYETGTLQDDVCAVRASQVYETALGYMIAGDYDNAAYDIGVMAHYISDPGVFGHTMGAYTDWGAEVHHQDYEDEFESILDTLTTPTGIALGDAGAYDATLQLAETTTFGDAAIQSNAWMDSNYDWADETFLSSAMASLDASVAAVASVINHLLVEANSQAPPPVPEEPLPPASLAASVQGSQVLLTWTSPPRDGGSDITGYVLYRGTDPESPVYLTTVSASTHAWNDDSVKRGKTYYYWVVAENSVGQSDMTRLASATIPRDSNPLVLAVGVVAALGALASGGVLVWRRRTRAGPSR